ncbi:hypothetical protein FSP39_001794 [Pinctada imbricata]|uniref:Uncharacterized protein n=1 Tax=Pinctada imbricata TaxID=66713 RepID=A0AA88Y2J9_PINIB|nr:hypothetical protein FSP39_001794 [Pinctada imbricata]
MGVRPALLNLWFAIVFHNQDGDFHEKIRQELNKVANDQQTYEVWFYFFMVLSLLLLCGIAIYVICIVFKNRRRKVMDKEDSLSSLSENTNSEEYDEADKEETSVLIPFEPTKANDKDDQENCAKVSESMSVQASDAHRPSLQQIIPSTTDNSPALNPVVTTADRCFQGPSMTEGQNILANTTQNGVHASFD